MKGKGFINLLAYFAVAFIAVALVLTKIFSAFPNFIAVANVLALIAQVVAYSITAVYAFYFAKSRKHIAWMISYVLFVITIIVFFVLGVI